MSFVQPSIEGPPSSVPDPWDWTVDQVVFILTDHDSPLLGSNAQLSLPDASSFARVLRENDVNGLALLTEVTTYCLRDELGIKSLAHRAAISHLIRQLQAMSIKFQEQTQHSARLSSVGLGSRLGSPYFATPFSLEPRAASRALGSIFSPDNSSAPRQDHFGLGQYPAQPHNIVKEGPAIQEPDQRTHIDILRSLEYPQDGEGLGINVTEGKPDQVKPEKTMNNTNSIASSQEDHSSSNAKNASIVEWAGRHDHRGETIVVDDQGRKRRRLVMAQPDTSRSMHPNPAILAASDGLPSSPETLRKDTNANPSFESSVFPPSDCPIPDEHLSDTQELAFPVQAAMLVSDTVPGSVGAAAKPGTVLVDENGRKRIRPTLLHEADLGSEHQKPLKPVAQKANGNCGPPTSDHREVKYANQQQQRSNNKNVKRSADQVYLGLESMPIDTLIYGDVALGKDLDKIRILPTSSKSEQTDEPDNFFVVPNSNVGKGQRLYVNARMKYLLQAQTLSLKRDGRDYIGFIPYPDIISKKNCPLSITIFSLSSSGVTASRANRSEWTRERVVSDVTEADERTGSVFNVADPALALDESKDPEWKALEKWNFMDGEDKILPVYGESDSEGQYDLETWREMEEERGKIPRPLGRSKSAKISSAEVQGAIDIATEQIIRDWTLRRLPKLKPKAWRLWVKSRRNRNSRSQIESFTCELERLEARIAGLRKEIAREAWSKTSQIHKQCKIIQPSIFDREDYRWRISTLNLQKVPEKVPPVTKQPKFAKSPEPKPILEDGEESLTPVAETSDNSGDDLNDFIVEDDADENNYQPMIVDDQLTMADAEDGIDSDALMVSKPEPKTPTKQARNFSQSGHSPSNAIDLTQRSDPVESEDLAPKPARSFAIHTPPLYSSENDSEIFKRSRSTKPVFRVPPTAPKFPTKTTEIISLESDSDNSMGSAYSDPSGQQFPALSDVDGIRAMDAANLVERQDRKRLLIWTVAHTPASERQAAFKYLNKTSMEASQANVRSALMKLTHKRHLKDVDNANSRIMRIAGWCVCWTIPVRVTAEGLRIAHIRTTLDDEDGYEPFYDFLLECMQHYQKVPSISSQKKPKKKRELIVRKDSDNECLPDSQTRKRKYLVAESQETLDKRHAAQDRFRANEERRRREELKHRFTRMSTDNRDISKVVVNPGKLVDQDFVYLNPNFGNGAHIKPHQEEGLQFLWREITSEHEDLQGCLLAQTMGLGKTMQVLALLVTLSEAASSPNKNLRDQIPPDLRESRTLILCPPALVENWWDECLLWPPQPLSDNVGELRKVTSAMKQADRHIEIRAWSKAGGILLLGFDTFKSLIHNRPRTSAKTKDKVAPLDDQQHEILKKALLERPTLVVADEAHQFKSKSSSLNLAMKQIKTKSRIALTGSPLNNNLGEYHSLIDWIAPGYLGTYTEFKATYEEPISEGLYQDSTESQYRESRKRLKALELELEPKVHRANISCLHADLKGKSEFVIRVPLTDLQRDLYRIYVDNMRTASSGKEPGTATLWSWLSVLRLLCNHPKCYKEKLLEVEPGSGSSAPALEKRKTRISLAEETLIGSDDDVAISDELLPCVVLAKTKDESRKVLESLTEPIDALVFSHKTRVLMNILKFSQDAYDKVLVFSHSIPTLNYIGGQLRKMDKAFVRIDGKVDPQKRQAMTKVFNERDINICLISTRAGGQGLNMFGANRVVILDDHFNPTWEQQAIGRAYRIGQQKPVYVYRLTVGGTFEQAIQNQALFKEQLATRVVDKKNPNRSALKGAGQYLFPPKTVDQEDLSPFLGKDPLVLDRLLAAPKE